MSALIVNISYLKTWSGILKLLQLIWGIICIGIVGNQIDKNYGTSEEHFFLLMVTTFMIGTFIFLVSCLVSLSTASVVSKTIYDFFYNAFAFILLLASSLILLVNVNYYKNTTHSDIILLTVASICGLINAVLYLLSTITAVRNYKGI